MWRLEERPRAPGHGFGALGGSGTSALTAGARGARLIWSSVAIAVMAISREFRRASARGAGRPATTRCIRLGAASGFTRSIRARTESPRCSSKRIVTMSSLPWGARPIRPRRR